MVPKRILLADANVDCRELLCHYLDSLRYPAPSQANDGEEALNKALAERPDLIIMEVLLPKKNGFQVVRDLRANRLTRDTVILAATAMALPDNRKECLRGGFNEYLAKPFTPKELNDVLRALFCNNASPSK